ncbi:sulfatase [Salipiger sp. PrR002]|uniref:sulfatase family protein n=1 Tax=Salipiger sp. PrR002 TaxID=2706489 RepID=UPI0013B73395|nr:sulfatase-like hydrolase/transferase [Salipiger sp. PrR002]NDW01747.1 sulfatase-like hydrolase/transferase [Salipiger sp. PrR002]NDW57816.1 sulfatase-like hydrolase/transferase [Salipiger sp. PrR004]
MPSAKQPNIVFIITDQQRHDTIAAHGYPHMVTPNLDKMTGEGVSFSNMYVTSPSCAPSRASLFTGLYPHTNGVFRNDERWPQSWVGRLANSGYRCVNVGKMHTSPFEQSFGFHERHVVENKDRATSRLPYFMDNWDKAIFARGEKKPSRRTYRLREDYRERLGAFTWELPTDLHADVFVTDLACEWLDTYPDTGPFFLQIGLPGPHPPYDPPAEYLEIYKDREIPLPIRDEAAMQAQPEAIKRLRQQHISVDHDSVAHLESPTEAQMRAQRQHYFANVTLIDDQVGKLFAALERRGVLEDTIVIFTSDHGDSLNDHGLSQKWSMYEGSCHIPAMIWSADCAAPGRVVDDMVSLFDFGPTILEAARSEVPAFMEAQSLVPYLAAERPEERREVAFSEHAGDRILDGTEFMTMIRTPRWKLIYFVEGCGQLFDMEADPTEVNDLWSDPAHEDTRRDLLTQILNWRLRSSVKTQGWQFDA